MKTIIGLLFLMVAFSGKAQTAEELIGRWKYEDLYEKDNMKEKKIEYTDLMLSDMLFIFKAGSRFLSSGMGKVEEGVWTLEEKEIHFKPDHGKKSKLEIISYDQDHLTVRLGRESFILVREIR